MAHSSIRSKMQEAFRRRIYVFIVGVAVYFIVILLQVINLQLFNGSDYKLRAKLNMEDYIPIPASRGEFYDRNYNEDDKKNSVIVSNRPSFNITTVRAKFKNADELKLTFQNLSNLVSFDVDTAIKEINTKNKWQRFVILEDVPFEKVVQIASHQELYSNINYEDAPVRVYNFNSLFSHIVGYIGSINSREYKKLKSEGYKYYHKIGKSGLEKQYDDILRGKDGKVRRIVDVKNRTEGEEVGQEPVSGNNLVLTVDYNIQKAAYDAIGDYTGTCVVLKANTGEVIAMVSKPDYDPNIIISKNNSALMTELQKNKKNPFLNRAIQAKYPPASTFKLVTAISALEEDKWKPGWKNYCPGYYVLHGYVDRTFQCYKGTAHGSLNLLQAIGKSCNVYFYNLGYKIGPTPIMQYAQYLGLKDKTNIDLPGEISGFVPTKKWKLKTFGESWYDGDTINLAIGQGFTSVTPLAMANLVSGIVNQGIIYRPHLVSQIRSQDNKTVISDIIPEKIKEVPLSSKTVDNVKMGMRLSVLDGTSVRLRYLKIPFAGKTGTAQTRSKIKAESTQHAWFVGFGPYGGEPENTYVIAVLIERGIAGAATAVPVAEKVLSQMISQGYFNDSQK